MTMAMTKAVEEGARAVICASTGNTSASAAAYAGHAGLVCGVIVPEGKIAVGKLAQAVVHGARVIQIDGNFDDALRMCIELDARYPVTLVNSVNPYRIDGQRSGAWEVCDQLGRAPDQHFMPVGNAGNITAYWKGYQEYHAEGKSTRLPKMVGFQAAGSAPIYHKEVVPFPETVATAIRIGHPQSWDYAWKASKESGGWFDECSDAEILAAQKLLAEKEGIFCEPASAASLAGALRDVKAGRIPAGSSIVCTLTGNGLKDPDTAIKQCSEGVLTVDAALEPVRKAIMENLA